MSYTLYKVCQTVVCMAFSASVLFVLEQSMKLYKKNWEHGFKNVFNFFIYIFMGMIHTRFITMTSDFGKLNILLAVCISL